MNQTPIGREKLKLACLHRLSQVAMDHPKGHQGKLAARYVLRSQSGMRIEMMFEKGPKSATNLWMCHRFVKEMLTDNFTYRLSLAQSLNKIKGKNGKPQYGRHSALRPMPQLGAADLVCFNIQSEAQLAHILEGLLAL